jgi:hypothetical protein
MLVFAGDTEIAEKYLSPIFSLIFYHPLSLIIIFSVCILITISSLPTTLG